MFKPEEITPDTQVHIGVFHLFKQTDEDVKRLEELLNDPDVQIVKMRDEFDRDGGYHVVVWYRLPKGANR